MAVKAILLGNRKYRGLILSVVSRDQLKTVKPRFTLGAMYSCSSYHIARTMATHAYSPEATSERVSTDGKYLLPSDHAELERLDLQHQMLKRAFNDNRLFPSELHLNDNDKILDAGTGTGAWAMDIASEVSSAIEVSCIDIQNRLFPSVHAKNISFYVCSVTALPSDWSSTFTVAHERLLISGLGMNDWKKALSQLYRVLKPGGWLILEEVDMLSLSTEGMKPDPPATARLRRGLRALTVSHNISPDAILKMSDMVREAGFEDLSVKWRILSTGPGEKGKDTTIAFTGSSKGFKAAALAGGGFGLGTTGHEFDKMMDDCVEEWTTVGAEHKFLSWTARKPTV